MPHCFVIQPFDGGKFDKRYDDVFAPAITIAGLEPYRVDRDPGVTVPVEEIHRSITTAVACLSDITTDNPNVWFELGVAIASKRLVVIICSKERTRFPFDVQHFSIIHYATDSSSDFDKLREDIALRLKTLLAKEQQLEGVASISSVAKVQGLEAHEIAALVSVAQEVDAPGDGVAAYTVRQGMEAAGFTRLATTLALHSLIGQLWSRLDEIVTTTAMSFSSINLPIKRCMAIGKPDKLPLRSDRAEKAHAEPEFTEDDIPF